VSLVAARCAVVMNRRRVLGLRRGASLTEGLHSGSRSRCRNSIPDVHLFGGLRSVIGARRHAVPRQGMYAEVHPGVVRPVMTLFFAVHRLETIDARRPGNGDLRRGNRSVVLR
jgi:hypothetical protein